MRRCPFCECNYVPGVSYALMCDSCRSSHRRSLQSGDVFDEMLWAAKRARWCERRRKAKKKS